MKRLLLLPFLCAAALLPAQESFRKDLQTKLILAESGDTIRIPAGTFELSASLSLDGKEGVVIMGAGKDQTVLSFKGQQEGAEGLRISNCKNIHLAHFTLADARGDCLKALQTDGIAMTDLRAIWTGKPKASNGSYGFYPVQCSRVLIDRCEAVGASDAGIYVGQSHNIIVRNCVAHHNVAGIEIENSTMADVFGCNAYENTGGILVFDLPDLIKKKGGNVRVYQNEVYDNNYRNFAPKGNSVAMVPPGTGIMVMATSQVEVYANEVRGNISAPISVVSYYITETPIQDKEYDPYPTAVYIHDNQVSRPPVKPTLKSKLGLLLFAKFGRNVPEILYDGIVNPKVVGSDGQVGEEFRLCIRNNGQARFANLDAEHNFKNIQTDLAPYDCERASLSAPELSMK
jgi:parallel beta-helix repeat protein